jgi:thiol-disulfide isomerase/thioredoxin
MNRRHLLIGGLGAGALALGAGLALRREPKPVSAAAQTFWSAKFQHLDGSELAVAGLRGKPLLLNFWASWCVPCVKELPEIAFFGKESPQWQVLGLAIDEAAAVQTFLKRMTLDMPLGLAGLTGFDMTRTLGNTQGGLPFSVAFDADGEIVWRKLGATNLAELRQMAAKQA